ncbi:Pimeloyl-ACP methyl ester carboxylesterase [Variovorax sp. EL159]|nr:Pimeloyl-ACP methyl ester carboxylesterase [Variovorax sp. EL159]
MSGPQTPMNSVDASLFTRHFRSPEARSSLLDSYARVLARWPVPYESRYVETRYGRAHVLASGPAYAPPVVLLHGSGGNATTWIHNIARLSGALQIYAVDIIGDAGRTEGRRPVSEDAYCNWLEDVLIGLGRPKVGLCGASFGAWLAAAYLRQTSRRVSKLALLAPANLDTLRPAFVARAAMAAMFPSEKLVRGFQAQVSSPMAPEPPGWAMDDLLVRWRCQRGSPRPPGRMSDADLRVLPKHTLLMLGEDEALYDPVRARARVLAHAPHVQVEMLPGAGHTLAYDQPDKVGDALVDFFRRDGWTL